MKNRLIVYVRRKCSEFSPVFSYVYMYMYINEPIHKYLLMYFNSTQIAENSARI